LSDHKIIRTYYFLPTKSNFSVSIKNPADSIFNDTAYKFIFMRSIPLFFFIVFLFSCNQSSIHSRALQANTDSLEKQLAATYKPGFGEFMSSIQSHHAKLWFAGQNNNWKLADFEIHEIMEAIENIQQFQKERKESQLISMIQPALDSVNNAIAQKNTPHFISSYTLLTNTCNNCHKAANFEFNVVKIPEQQMFSNQDFKVH
jgi:hypothetical protein